MGMYTKYYGTLNVSSINNKIDVIKYWEKKLEEFKKYFKEKNSDPHFRSWIVDSCTIVYGHNGCVNISFTGEIKNYNDELWTFYYYMTKHFRTGEGVFYKQYEINEYPDIYLVSHGTIKLIKPVYLKFYGYGNGN